MKITFLGAAKEVTGSRHLLEVNGKRILLDCGLFQGKRKEADEKNRQGSTIPLRTDLAADLREWLAEKSQAFQEAAGEAQAVRFDPQSRPNRKTRHKRFWGLPGAYLPASDHRTRLAG